MTDAHCTALGQCVPKLDPSLRAWLETGEGLAIEDMIESLRKCTGESECTKMIRDWKIHYHKNLEKAGRAAMDASLKVHNKENTEVNERVIALQNTPVRELEGGETRNAIAKIKDLKRKGFPKLASKLQDAVNDANARVWEHYVAEQLPTARSWADRFEQAPSSIQWTDETIHGLTDACLMQAFQRIGKPDLVPKMLGDPIEVWVDPVGPWFAFGRKIGNTRYELLCEFDTAAGLQRVWIRSRTLWHRPTFRDLKLCDRIEAGEFNRRTGDVSPISLLPPPAARPLDPHPNGVRAATLTLSSLPHLLVSPTVASNASCANPVLRRTPCSTR